MTQPFQWQNWKRKSHCTYNPMTCDIIHANRVVQPKGVFLWHNIDIQYLLYNILLTREHEFQCHSPCLSMCNIDGDIILWTTKINGYGLGGYMVYFVIECITRHLTPMVSFSSRFSNLFLIDCFCKSTITQKSIFELSNSNNNAVHSFVDSILKCLKCEFHCRSTPSWSNFELQFFKPIVY